METDNGHDRVEYARPELLIDPGWVMEHKDDPSVVVIDCDGLQTFQTRPHVPGAVALPVHPYFRNTDTFEGVATPEQAESILQSLGVYQDSKVVLYDSQGGLMASRTWWVLWYYGHENVALINGGWPAWIASRMPTTQQHPDVTTGNWKAQVHEDRIASCDLMLPGIQSGDTVALDVRSDEEWTGEKPAPNATNQQEGRIPGAIHIEWRQFVDWDNATRFKPAIAIRQLLDRAGLTFDKRVVPY